MPWIQRNEKNEIIGTFANKQNGFAVEYIEDSDKEYQNFIAPTYKELRQKAYATIGEQLDMIYHDQINDTSIWEDHITQVKATYPKT